MVSSLRSLSDRFLRRLLDIVASLLGILILSPLLVVVPILLRRDSPGPLFFRGERVGLGGKTFQILKFRTMYATPESFAGPKVSAHDDPRITPLGAWLRTTKINELPQFWNVLRGDMSLVGPRPEDPAFVEEWPEDVRKILLSVKPGITSPASVVYRNLEHLLHSDRVVDEYLHTILPTKMRFDTLYVRNRTLLTDLDVIFWTLVSLLPIFRRNQVPETQLFWGPLSTFMTNHFRWFVIDFFVSLVSIAIVGVIWRSITPLFIGWFWAPVIAFETALIFGTLNSLMGLNRIFWSRARPSDALDLALSSALSIALLLGIDFLLIQQPQVPAGLYLFGGLLSFLGFLSVRYRERLLTGVATRWLRARSGRQSIGERVLIVGAGELGEFSAWLVRTGELARAFYIAGMVDDDPKKQGMRIDGIRVIGTTRDLPEIIRKRDIGIIFFAISNIHSGERDRIVEACRSLPVRLVHMPNVVKMMRQFFFNELPFGLAHEEGGDGLFAVEGLGTRLHELDQLLAEGDIDAARTVLEQLREIVLQSNGSQAAEETVPVP